MTVAGDRKTVGSPVYSATNGIQCFNCKGLDTMPGKQEAKGVKTTRIHKDNADDVQQAEQWCSTSQAEQRDWLEDTVPQGKLNLYAPRVYLSEIPLYTSDPANRFCPTNGEETVTS
ncbi:hypothetical protein Tco_1113196 [Tanacetum coccineum]|uniref:Uncharacterized protein n=1 Tax=Tanacetum coccineum TaxID=301880 RepID=A0ABQ5IRG5_9ASTR